MKPTQFITSLICFALWQTAAAPATKYWDIDGATPGAGGATPAGTWNTGTTANWTTSSTGSTAGTTWASGDDAVFSAGTDATGAFTNVLDNTASPPVQNAGNLTVEEGTVTIAGDPGILLNIGGGVAGKGIINVAAGASATISAELDSLYGTLGDNNGQLTKTGPGTLTLSAVNNHTGTNLIAEGVLIAENAFALGATTPTIVSNGAALQMSTTSMSEPVILNGSGITNGGALRGHTASASWTGGATLGSDARINAAGGTWTWTAAVIITNGLNNADLYFGGTGTSIRLNINVDYPAAPGFRRPCIDVGDGVIYKDGSVELRFENSNIAREVRFNEGHIMARCGPGTNFCYRAVVPGFFWCTEGVFWSSGDYVPATIYVGPNAGQFRNGANGPSQEWDHPIVLAAGANPVFRPQSFTDAYIICNGLISGLGGLSKFNDTGTLFLRSNNTYYGDTTIRGGALTLGASGSISNSAVIDVWTNGVFNVTSNAGGFVLQPAQTLKGNGTVLGNVNAKGTISPGASLGSLTNEGSLTLGGSLLIEVDKSLSPGSSNDLITVSGSLTHSGGGSLTVVNLGPALATNDSFQIFNKAVSGGQTITVTGASATWTNKLAVDGSIGVLTVTAAPPPVPATNLTIQAAGPTSFNLGGMGGPSSLYDVYASTNVALPMSSWWKIGTTNSSGGGAIQFLDAQATNAQRFYRFGQPSP